MSTTDDAPLGAMARKLRRLTSDEEYLRFERLYRSIGQCGLDRLTPDEIEALSSWATLIREREHRSTSITTASSLMADLDSRMAARGAIHKEMMDQYW